MAKISNLPAYDIISGFKGTIDYYLNMGLICVRKWPRSPGKHRSPAVEAQWPTFTEASQLYVQLSPEVVSLYRDMASGTPYTSRDLFMRSYMSGLFQPPPHL